MQSRGLLWFECLVIFAGLPALLAWQPFSITFVTVPLLIVAVPAVVWLLRHYGTTVGLWWTADRRRERQQLPWVLIRFCLSALLLLLVAWWTIPDRLFDLPQQNMTFWLLFLLVYPFLSVYPQELLYRAFFFRRYAAILPTPALMILINAVLFSWMHIIFHSPIAMFYTFVGSLYFSHTYIRSGSLRLVCLEHSLYGSWLMTIGYSQDLLTDTLVQHLGL